MCQLCARSFPSAINLALIILCEGYYYPCFTDERTEAQRKWVAWLSHSAGSAETWILTQPMFFPLHLTASPLRKLREWAKKAKRSRKGRQTAIRQVKENQEMPSWKRTEGVILRRQGCNQQCQMLQHGMKSTHQISLWSHVKIEPWARYCSLENFKENRSSAQT